MFAIAIETDRDREKFTLELAVKKYAWQSGSRKSEARR
jgi:hypothetical protein